MGIVTGPQGCIIKSVTPNAYNAAVNNLQKSVDFLNKSLSSDYLNTPLYYFNYYAAQVVAAKEDLAALGGVSVNIKQPTVDNFSFTGSTKIHLLKVTDNNFDVSHVNTTLNTANANMLEFEAQLDIAIKDIQSEYQTFVSEYSDSESGDSSYNQLINQIMALVVEITQGAHLNNEQLQEAAEEASSETEVEIEEIENNPGSDAPSTTRSDTDIFIEHVDDINELIQAETDYTLSAAAAEQSQEDADTAISVAVSTGYWADNIPEPGGTTTLGSGAFADGSSVEVTLTNNGDGTYTMTNTVTNAADGNSYTYTSTYTAEQGPNGGTNTVSINGSTPTTTTHSAAEVADNNMSDRMNESSKDAQEAQQAKDALEQAEAELESKGFVPIEGDSYYPVGESVGDAEDGAESGIGGGLSIEDVESDFEGMFD